MDIHESFGYKLESFKEIVEKINEKPGEDEKIDPSAPYISKWEYFESFLSELISDNDSRFRRAILMLFFNEEQLELHEKVKELFNLLVEYEDKTIVSMVYNSEYDKVTIDFDKSEDMTKEEDVVETDKKILGNLLNYCKENQIRIAQNNGELFVEIGDDSKGTYHCYEGADLEISENTKITDFE